MLADKDKTKEQLINELVALRQRLGDSEASEMERNSPEKILRSSEETYRNLVNMSPEIMFYGSPKDGAFVFLSPAFEKITGWSRTEWLGRPFMSMVHPDDLPLVIERFQRGLAGEAPPPFEARFLSKSGDYLVGEVVGAPHIVDGELVGGYGFVRNVTEHKRAEELLREGEHKYRVLFESTLDGLCVIDAETMKIVLANQAATKLYGFDSPQDVIGMNPLDFVPLDDRERVIRHIAEDMFQKDLREVNEFRTITRDGREIWISAMGVRTEYQGKSSGLISFRDVTERKQMEEALLRYKLAVDGSADLINAVDLQHTYLFVNQTFLRYHCLKQDQVVGHTAAEILGEEVFKKVVKPNVDRCLQGEIVEHEMEYEYPEVGRRYLNVRYYLLKGSDEKTTGTVAVVRDITEQKLADAALRASEENFRHSLDSSPLGIRIVTAEGETIYANQAMLDIYGYNSIQELKTMSRRERYTPESYAEHLKRKEMRKRGEIVPTPYEISIIRKDSDVRHLLVSRKEVVWDGKIQYQTLYQDITERKQAEEALKKSERKYKELAESITDVFFAFDKELRYTYWNKASEELTGTLAKDALGKHLYDIFPRAEMTKKAEKAYLKVLTTKQPQHFINEYQVQGKNLIFEISAYPSGDGLSVFVKDITERKQAEELHKTIIETAMDGFWLVDIQGRFLDVNDAYCQLIGYSRDELLKMSIPDVEAIEKPEETAARIAKIKKVGGDRFESRHKCKDGRIVDVEVSVNYIEVGGGRFFVFVRDITERKQAEELYQTLAKNSPVGIYIVQDNKFCFVNPQFQKYTGYSEDELLNMAPRDFVHPEDWENVRRNAVQMLKGELISPYEFRVIQPDGEIHWAMETVTSIYYNGKRATLGNFMDITERKQAEEREKNLQRELYLSSRLAAIGELSAGVAHEINNPLTGILGFSERLLRKSSDQKVRRDLERIHGEAQRATNVVHNLLMFSRRREQQKEYSDINDVVQQALELRAYELRTSNIEVTTNLAPALPKVLVDFRQMQQVFLNIIINAEQAMVEANRGGKLVIKTEGMEGYIRVSFTDDGPGIAPEDLDKIFNPFFTTRAQKGGTGLGLSISYGVVVGHGGRIYAENNPGQGVTFFVELPLTADRINT